MELEKLQIHMSILATLPETNAPVISYYRALENGRLKDRNVFDERIRSLEKGLSDQTRRDFEEALAQIETYLTAELLHDAKGAAIFSRAGNDPFFLPLQFRVSLPNWIAVDTMPNIYHLVELKDNYHRYIVMISTEENARILEVNLGSVTEGLWKQRPELRKRVGREWTKEHYQNHQRDRTQKFLREKIEVLKKLMSSGGYAHLILAGHPTITKRVRSKLPKHLEEKLIDVLPASGKTPVSDIVDATIASFIEAEEKESRAAVEKLERQIYSGGLAVVGTGPSFQALRRGQVDMLVLTKEYAPDLELVCSKCGIIDSKTERPDTCPLCSSTKLKNLDIKEAMVRMAEKHGCTIEVVDQSDILMRFGGVGCLLRYRLPEEYL